jgi:demethoxyubiquinone hydroxylase (CLK1/Coq7/Cat5 family)
MKGFKDDTQILSNMAAIDIKKRTEYFIKDLHAREYMRLGCYRQIRSTQRNVDLLRERKARHEAFLRDLLRKRGINPFWYARVFYIVGHIFGVIAARLPQKWVAQFEDLLEFWILMRYQQYLKEMTFDAAIRSMVEALQLNRLPHNEPGTDVLFLLDSFVKEQEKEIETSLTLR